MLRRYGEHLDIVTNRQKKKKGTHRGLGDAVCLCHGDATDNVSMVQRFFLCICSFFVRFFWLYCCTNWVAAKGHKIQIKMLDISARTLKSTWDRHWPSELFQFTLEWAYSLTAAYFQAIVLQSLMIIYYSSLATCQVVLFAPNTHFDKLGNHIVKGLLVNLVICGTNSCMAISDITCQLN